MTYGGSKRLLEIAESVRHTCITLCRKTGAFWQSSPAADLQKLPDAMKAEYWGHWIEQESRKRLGLSCFVSSPQICRL
jgi:hypothetical protein